eukprot:TRINITY_DN97712_c0_g1_i1.p1 TRINITY_DN97712_c0_g1~~TRINITY_DN97712_c0_g1_i1.p1  ORF type:complete len:295 (-),score=89.21 TRINITY_DN97712_c0_g1_i1:292-1131(-)
MPAKAGKGPSKKTVEKQKMKIVEDKTFGLKNKNKSAKVQKYCQEVNKQVMHGNKKRSDVSAAEEKKKRKAEEAARLAELKSLFKVAPPKPKTKKSKKKEGEGGEDDDEEKDDAYAGVGEEEEYLWNADDFDAVEQDETRLEEKLQKELEELRERLATEGGGTKVTEDTFQAWKKKQREEAQREEKKKKKKMEKTGKWTGRALFEHDASLFVDDDDADEDLEREEDEIQPLKEGEEEVKIKKWEEAAEEALDPTLFEGEDLEIEDVEDDDEPAAGMAQVE